MSRLANSNPTLAHSYFLTKVLPILERLVPVKASGGGGRSSLHRSRKLIWRKLRKVKTRLERANSIQKIAKLLQDKQDLESELKNMYSSFTQEAEAKVISGMRENVNVFFSYAKARQKTQAKVGPFLDPQTSELNLDPDFSAKCLSEQYSSVFTPPRPEWTIDDIEEFFKVDSNQPTGPILADFDFTEDDIEHAVNFHPLLLLDQMESQPV